MTHHPRTGFGDETTKSELEEIGRAEVARYFIGHLQGCGCGHDPALVEEWFVGRTGLDAQTRALIMDGLFPQKRKARTVTSARPVSFRAAAAVPA